MKKLHLNVWVAVLSVAVMLVAGIGLYKTEANKVETLGENRAYINSAQEVLTLSEELGVKNEAYPVSFETPLSADGCSEELQRLGEELRWLADYNTDGSRLNRAADKLTASESVTALGSGATYGEMANAAISSHQAEIDSINASARTWDAVLIVLFVIGLGGLSYAASVSIGKK